MLYCVHMPAIPLYSLGKRRLAAGFIFLGTFLVAMYAGSGIWNRVVPERIQLPDMLAETYRLGLDLQGGTHLVYQADFSGVEVENKHEAMRGLREVIERRVNIFGVSEPLIQVDQAGNDWRLIVELAGVKDIGEAIRLIGITPQLEFRETTGTSTLEFLPARLTGKYLKHAQVEFDSNTNAPYIAVEFNDEGAKLFEEITERNVGKPVGIFLDGQLTQAPVVQEKITGGSAVITGQFTLPEAKSRVRDLNAGALPVPINLISQQSVEASLGKDSLEASLLAGVIGFLVVAAFMILWYRLPGTLAVFALLIYATIVLGIFKLIPVTLTVAGIAGFILSIGMAVDANILIFERMKEELRKGKRLPDAVSEGFQRAWTSIRDSNVSSLITAAILYWLGTSVVKGFATTLAIGVLVSMLTALTVTKTLLLATLARNARKWLYLSGIAK